MKPVSEYTVIGKSFPELASSRPKSPPRSNGRPMCGCPDMLHARMVHPKTLGSTLVSVGDAGQDQFPNAQVIVKGNLVGVVAPTEWEAITRRAAGGRRHEVDGLERTARPCRPVRPSLREDADWKTAPASRRATSPKETCAGDGDRAERSSPPPIRCRIMKHAPIGPTMAVADARKDGTVYVYTHNQNPQALRGEIAQMLEHDGGQRRRAHVRRAGPLWAIERRERRRGRRSGDPVAGRGQAGARAVDAAGGFPVVDAIARGVFGCRNRTGRKRQDGGVPDRPLHARDAG